MSLNTGGVGAEGLLAAKDALSAPAELYGNDSRVEELWAMKVDWDSFFAKKIFSF